jgi:DNA polymerase III delta prime subunit
MPQPAWLVYGPPGCGKTTWILNQVRMAKKKLYHWNARTDKSLREGRELLHQQVRSQEPLIVWIEGADDFSPEAQAFLRRILETVSQNVQCILECRDPQKITPAIQSRCAWRQIPNTRSFREQKHQAVYKQLVKTPLPLTATLEEQFKAAEQPIKHIQEYLKHPTLWKDALVALRAVGAGSSPWAHWFSLRAAECESAADK